LFPIIPLPPDGPDDPAGGQRRLLVREDVRGGSTSWMVHGACRGADPELFFPIGLTGGAGAQIDSARAICGRCAVSKDCLSYAMRTMPHGIWGGTTREERIAMRFRSAARSRVQGSGETS
jgi:WhiB family redox-sensing transcriptional regulator